MKKSLSTQVTHFILRFPLFFSVAVILLGLALNFNMSVYHNLIDLLEGSKNLWGYGIIVFLALAFIYSGYRYKWWKRVFALPDQYLVAIVLLAGALTRFIIFLILDTIPRSDFGTIHELAIRFALGRYQPFTVPYVYPVYHNSTVIIYGNLYHLFGTQPQVIKLVNLVSACALCVLLFYSGKMIGYRKEGFLAGLLFALWPSQILYINVLSPENIYVFFQMMFLFFYAFSRKLSKDTYGRKLIRYGIYFLLGLITALSEALRPFGLIGMIAFIIADLVGGYDGSGFFQIKRLFFSLSLLGVSLLGFLLCRQIPVLAYEKMNQTKYLSTKSVNVLIGVNFETNGMWSGDDWDFAEKVLTQVENREDEFNAIILNAAFQRVKENTNQIGTLLLKKIRVFWSGDAGIYWAVTAGHFGAREEVSQVSGLVNALYMIGIALLMIFTYKNPDQEMVKPIIYCVLVIFGFNLMEFVGEVQSRYMTVLTPYMAFLAGFGAVNLGRILRARKWLKVKRQG